jgi:integration host factor subunit beta
VLWNIEIVLYDADLINISGDPLYEQTGANRRPKKYKAYAGRNPKTGEKVQIKPKKLPYFNL